MYYPDLSPYRYTNVPTGLPGVVNVGWLSSAAPYEHGKGEQPIVRILAELATAPILLTQGVHSCDFCRDFEGNGEIWISSANDLAYAAPSMISHYVDVHEYVPPAVFLAALSRAHCAISEHDCRARIANHQRKLETAPEPEDIIVPYYSARIWWDPGLFGELGEFEAFVSLNFPFQFPSIAVGLDGYFVRTETADPRELFSKIVDKLTDSGPSPFKCTFQLVHVGGGASEILARDMNP